MASVASRTPTLEDRRFVEALRGRDEDAFTRLLDAYHGPLLRLARVYVRDRAVAEEVVQETWLGVVRGLDRFEGRSSLKTWIFRILANTARKRAVRESRSVPFSALVARELEADEPAVSPERFIDASAPRWAGHWAAPPPSLRAVPEERLLGKEARSLVEAAIESLPPVQRQVITLRDVEGFASEEVCSLLDISEGNQRVLLHRARSKVRAALEVYVVEAAAS